MLKIGLTGNIGSGKSVVSCIFEIIHIPVFHSDEAAKHVLDNAENIAKLENLFGKEIFDQSGKADRKKIASIVFNDIDKLTALNNIIHPVVIKEFEKWITHQGSVPYVVMESAILYETGYAAMFDRTILVTAPEEIRIARVMARDGAADVDVKIRIQNQMAEAEKTVKADYIIINDDHQLVIPQVLKLNQCVLALNNQ